MLGYGKGFGEVALTAKTQEEAIRLATIVATEPVELLVLDKESYVQSLHRGQTNKECNIIDTNFYRVH